MMILIVPAVIALILYVIAFISERMDKFDLDIEWRLKCIAWVLLIIVVCAAITAFFINQCADSSTASYSFRYETLVYQLENGAYGNTIEYSRKDLMDDIYDYNSHVESGRILSKNPWIGIYYPEDWDNLPLIRLEDYK